MEAFGETELCFPQLLNSSCVKTKRPHYQTMLTYTLLFSLSVLTAFLNLLVVISISHFKQLHTPTNLLLLSLAVSDFFISFLLLFQIALIDGCWFLGDLMCSLYQYLAAIITAVSVETMVLISVDRYVAICDPLRYSTKITPTTVKICVSLCWFCSVMYASFNLMVNMKQAGSYGSCFGECVIVVNYVAGVLDVIVFFIGPITVIIVLYVRVFVVAASQARAVRSHIAAVTLQGSVKATATKSELKAARTLGVVVVVFLMCLCPYYCVALTNQDSQTNASSAAFLLCLYYLNSCLNPVIYACFYPWFRKSVKVIVTLKILQPGSREANML